MQAMVNVPHELPGTSRRAFSGRTKPLPCESELERRARGHRQPERLMKEHRLLGRLTEPVRGLRGDVVDPRAALFHGDRDARFLRIDQHRPRLERDLLAPERLDDHDPQPGQRDDDDVQDGERRGDTRRPADLLACQAGQASSAALGRERQHHHVLHRAGQADADDQPDQARQVAELDRQHGADQRAGPRDRREVMAEQDPAVGGVEVLAVAKSVRRGFPLIVEHGDAGREKGAVVSVGDRQDRQHPEHHRHCV